MKALGAILVLVVLVPVPVAAYFSGTAHAGANQFGAGTLTVVVSPANRAADISTAGTDSIDFTAVSGGNLIAQYQLTAVPTACASTFWQGIEVTVNQGAERYAGLLSALIATSSSTGTWELELTATSTLVAAKDEKCVIELTTIGWQELFITASLGGFSASDTVTLSLTATENIGQQATTNVVLNEIYPAVLATTTVPLEREWVELYNGTGASVDVLGYEISERTGGTTTGAENRREIVASCPTAGASSFMRPYGTTNTTIDPGSLLVVEFCGGGSYLNDGGDTIVLYQSTSSVVALDTHTYPSTANGKSHARIPDGGTWVDPVPTPGTPNTATAEELAAEGWSEEAIADVLNLDLPLSTTTTSFSFVSDDKDEVYTSAAKANDQIDSDDVNNANSTASTSPSEISEAIASTTAASNDAVKNSPDQTDGPPEFETDPQAKPKDENADSDETAAEDQKGNSDDVSREIKPKEIKGIEVTEADNPDELPKLKDEPSKPEETSPAPQPPADNPTDSV